MEPKNLLREMPRAWCTNLRWLRLSFMSFELEDCLLGSACYESWLGFTALIKQRLILERLTIELDFAYLTHDSYTGLYIMEETASPPYGNIIDIFNPGHGRHYKDFFIRIVVPVYSMEDDWRRVNLERQLEQQIMGPSYDAAAAGKYYDIQRYNESLRPKVWLKYDEDLSYNDPILIRP